MKGVTEHSRGKEVLEAALKGELKMGDGQDEGDDNEVGASLTRVTASSSGTNSKSKKGGTTRREKSSSQTPQPIATNDHLPHERSDFDLSWTIPTGMIDPSLSQHFLPTSSSSSTNDPYSIQQHFPLPSTSTSNPSLLSDLPIPPQQHYDHNSATIPSESQHNHLNHHFPNFFLPPPLPSTSSLPSITTSSSSATPFTLPPYHSIASSSTSTPLSIPSLAIPSLPITSTSQPTPSPLFSSSIDGIIPQNSPPILSSSSTSSTINILNPISTSNNDNDERSTSERQQSERREGTEGKEEEVESEFSKARKQHQVAFELYQANASKFARLPPPAPLPRSSRSSVGGHEGAEMKRARGEVGGEEEEENGMGSNVNFGTGLKRVRSTEGHDENPSVKTDVRSGSSIAEPSTISGTAGTKRSKHGAHEFGDLALLWQKRVTDRAVTIGGLQPRGAVGGAGGGEESIQEGEKVEGREEGGTSTLSEERSHSQDLPQQSLEPPPPMSRILSSEYRSTRDPVGKDEIEERRRMWKGKLKDSIEVAKRVSCAFPPIENSL